MTEIGYQTRSLKSLCDWLSRLLIGSERHRASISLKSLFNGLFELIYQFQSIEKVTFILFLDLDYGLILPVRNQCCLS